MTTSAREGLPAYRRHALTACGIAAFCSVALALLLSDIVREFFPYAEEWKILVASLPEFARPLQWFTRGFIDYTNPYPAWSLAAANFFRPVMEIVYWLRGSLFGDDWGAYLYFNFLFMGFAAGALYFCLRTFKSAPGSPPGEGAAGQWLAGAMALAFVLMPPMASTAARFQPVFLPQMGFDPLIAAFSLLACLCYVSRRHAAAAVLVMAALLTKEQALPLAAALPLVHAWAGRDRWRKALPALLVLALPLLTWVAMRFLLFGGVSQGVYVLMREPAEIVRAFVVNLLKLPLYAPPLSGALREPLSWQALLVACNGLVLVYLAVDVWRRWWTRGPDAVSVVVILSWGFLALVGLNPRYGAIIIALSFVMAARPAAAGVPALARSAALAAVFVSALVHGWLSLHSYAAHARFSQIVFDAGRAYAAALDQSEADLVVVLNDPNTMYTAPSDMAQVLEAPVTEVFKASDFPWRWPAPYAREILPQPCAVSVSVAEGTRVNLRQSCGFQIRGAPIPRETPVVLPIADGVRAEFPEAAPAGDGMDLGKSMVLQVERPGVAVLYFDPATGSFQEISDLSPGRGEGDGEGDLPMFQGGTSHARHPSDDAAAVPRDPPAAHARPGDGRDR